MDNDDTHFHLFQSTQPRGLRPGLTPLSQPNTPISIHAATRAATSFKSISISGFDISIHAATRAATNAPANLFDRMRDFNPRSHEGCDPDKPETTVFTTISIHAATRAATLAVLVVPTSRLFQSTQPRGLRLLGGFYMRGVKRISIHAATRAATGVSVSAFAREPISIHAATRAATGVSVSAFAREPISIHAATRAATCHTSPALYGGCDFNPRSHEGCDTARARL